MKKIFYLPSLLLVCLMSCGDDEQKPPASENDVDAVRNFVQSALQGDYEKAKTFMINDSINIERMDAVERVKLNPDEKRGLASASIIMHDTQRPNDSTTIVVYSNSFKKNLDTLRALRINGVWLVDFNYLFTHDSDTLFQKKDSIVSP